MTKQTIVQLGGETYYPLICATWQRLCDELQQISYVRTHLHSLMVQVGQIAVQSKDQIRVVDSQQWTEDIRDENPVEDDSWFHVRIFRRLLTLAHWFELVTEHWVLWPLWSFSNSRQGTLVSSGILKVGCIIRFRKLVRNIFFLMWLLKRVGAFFEVGPTVSAWKSRLHTCLGLTASWYTIS